MEFQVDCPSGAKFQFKEMGGREIIAIAERVGANASGETISSVLTSCCTQIIEPGPYPGLVIGKGSPNWMTLLYGDVIPALLRLRVKSFEDVGAAYDFDFACEYCGAQGGATIDLVELLEAPDHNRSLPEEAVNLLLAKQPFTVAIPARFAPRPEGVAEDVPLVETAPAISVDFDLHRMAQDAVMREKMKSAKRKKLTAVEQVATQIKSVQGLVTAKTGEPVRDFLSLWRWVQDQSAYTVDYLLAQMRAADCGVDPVVKVRCNGEDGCEKEQRIALPFGKSFFNPRSGATKKASTTKLAS